MSFNYHLTSDSVSLQFDHNSKNFNEVIDKSDSRYKSIVSLIWEGVGNDYAPETVKKIIGIVLRSHLKDGSCAFSIRNGELYIDNVLVPRDLSQKILEFEEAGESYDYLIKFFKRLNDNPTRNSREMLYKFLQHNGISITDRGTFIAYRAVTKDFKDHHTRTFDNSIGSVCEIPRDQVDPNPNNTCSSGLHVSTRSYALGFNTSDGHIVQVEVDPIDVVSVPVDYDGTKMRVSKFKVIGLSEDENTKPLIKLEEEKQEEVLPKKADKDIVSSDIEVSTNALGVSPKRFRRTFAEDWLKFIEVRNSTVTITFQANNKTWRYYDVPKTTTDLIWNSLNCSDGFKSLRSIVSSDVIHNSSLELNQIS